jgi:ketosteroid isomerase-like protein
MADSNGLTAEDRSEIQNLLAHYVKHLDTGDLDGYVSLFAADAVLFERHRGQAAIREYVGQIIERKKTEPGTRLHFMSPAAIDGAGDSATAYSYLLWVTTGATDSPVGAGARYEDTLAKQHGHWVFTSRRLTRTAEM